jgi:hypothetical protein
VKSGYQIADYLQVSRTSVNKWISQFLSGGLDALQFKKSPRRPCRSTDEQQNTTTRMWSLKGTRPDAIKQQQFEYAHIYGAICATNGKTEALITLNLSKKIMLDHLKLISDTT